MTTYPDMWTPAMIAGALRSAARNLQRTAVELDCLGIANDYRAQARLLMARRRRLLTKHKGDDPMVSLRILREKTYGT